MENKNMYTYCSQFFSPKLYETDTLYTSWYNYFLKYQNMVNIELKINTNGYIRHNYWNCSSTFTPKIILHK